ncbi:hypothetical protein TNCT_408591 [Trichonephila clavata]|uniref:Uncharacterized protein n=1 Tax=Trichonephila clavata TaxID=2740835 RepID=A0A8X6G7I9_TRICU|nr:hypothetical protein TNCT_408591 [Trichonephila clavata]
MTSLVPADFKQHSHLVVAFITCSLKSRKHFHLLWVEGYFCKMYLNSYKKSKSASNYMKREPGVESNYVQSL